LFEQIENNTDAGTTADESQVLTLFAGIFPSTSKFDVLAFLPSRPVVDRLVARFFNAKEPGQGMYMYSHVHKAGSSQINTNHS